MFLALLKKELILFCRQKINILLLFVFPIVLITTLALGLNDAMTGNSNIFGTEEDPSIVYYSVEGDKYETGFDEFKDAVQDEITMEFKEESLDNVQTEVDNYEAIAFVKVDDDGIELYTSKNGDDTKSKVFKCIIDTMCNNFSSFATIAKENPQALRNLMESKIDTVIKDETKDLRNSTSSEYYTFAELGLIILYVAVSVSQSTFEEKKLTTVNRIRMSKINEGKMVMAKVSFGIIVGIAQILIVYIYSTLALDVNWGENTIPFMLLFTSLAVFASMAGAICGLICSKEATMSGIINAIIVVICGFGGCYAPLFELIANPVMNNICKVSPLYWINICTNSMICGIKTDSFFMALLIPIALSIIVLIVYLIYNKRKGVVSDV